MIEYLFFVGESFITYPFYPILIPRRYYKQLAEEIYDGHGGNNIKVQVISPNGTILDGKIYYIVKNDKPIYLIAMRNCPDDCFNHIEIKDILQVTIKKDGNNITVVIEDIIMIFTDKLLAMGRKKGYLTYDEVNDLLPPCITSSDHIDKIIAALDKNNIDIIDPQQERLTTDEINESSIKVEMEISDKQRKDILEYFNSKNDLVKGLYDPAILFKRQGRYGEAMFCLRELFELSTDKQQNTKYLNIMGQIIEIINTFEEALKYYMEACALCTEPSDISYWINNYIGFNLSRLGRYIEAEKFCRIASEVETDKPNAFRNLGVSLEGQGRLQEAIDAYITATKINAKDFKALNLFEQLIKNNPELMDEYGESLKECRIIVEKACEYDGKSKQLH